MNALIRACENDFAIVGTTALFVNNTDPIVKCKDKQGRATGIPDLPELNTEPAHQRSPVSYPLIGIQRDYAQANETYTVNVGPERWFLNKYKKLSGVWLHAADLKASKYGNLPVVHRRRNASASTKDAEFDVSAVTPQPGYTTVRPGDQERQVHLCPQRSRRHEHGPPAQGSH